MTSTGVTRIRFDGGVSPRLRRAAVVWVVATLPLVTALGAFAHGQREYLLMFVLVASGLYTTPALLAAVFAIRNGPVEDRWYWWLWSAALICIYSTGVGILVGLGTETDTPVWAGIVTVGAGWVFLTIAGAGLVRSRSGRRALSVDVVEWLSFVVTVSAPAALLWTEAVLDAEDLWFAMPAALTTIGMVSGCYWMVVLFVRLGPERCPLETIGLALAMAGLANSVAQAAQGISGFTLPSAPLIGLHALCMSLLLLIPLHVPAQPSTGLDRLPPQAQVRGAGLPAAVILVGLPVLMLVALVQRNRVDWAVPFTLAIVVVLLALSAVRHLLAVRETRHLYALVEQASDDRRDLLARVIRRIDEDRHAVAAQLHEQAMSAYATFVSYLMATDRPVGQDRDRARSAILSSASAMVRDDLSRQAESLRQLMLAVSPLEAGRSRSESLRVPIQAYVHNLYGDGRVPQLAVAVDPDLELDWITETIVLRVVQEALRNVWRHSAATEVEVALRATRGAVEVEISDNGVGFDPDEGLYESGIAAMRSFAAFAGGSVELDSAPGTGTRVRVRVGEADVGQSGSWATA
jgi:signal transduction histidine kinase